MSYEKVREAYNELSFNQLESMNLPYSFDLLPVYQKDFFVDFFYKCEQLINPTNDSYEEFMDTIQSVVEDEVVFSAIEEILDDYTVIRR